MLTHYFSLLYFFFFRVYLFFRRGITLCQHTLASGTSVFNVSAKRFYSSRSDSFLCPVFFLFFSATARIILRRFGPRDSSEVLRRWLIGRFNLRDSPNARRR